MQRITKTCITTAALALACLLPASALAYSYSTYCGKRIKWSDGTVHLRHAVNSFPVGSRLRERSAETVANFNQNPGDVRLTAGWDDGNVWFGNSQNEIWFTTKDIDAPARTRIWYMGLLTCNPRIHETDVQFQLRPDHSSIYTSSTATHELWGYDGDWRPYATTLMHELGHVIGLDHESRYYNVMGADWNHIHANDGHARAYLGENAGHGAVFLYGETSNSMEDLSVSHWKYIGDPNNNGYSDHDRCAVRNGNGGWLAKLSYGWDPVYKVRRGQTIQVEFTYENNGRATQSAPVGFYLSTTDRITTLDRRIGGWSAVLARNAPATVTRTVTIPHDAPLGYAWLGAYVDDDGSVFEMGQALNTAYHRLYVYP